VPNFTTGLYHSRSSAEEAVDKLESLGYRRDDISVIMHDRTRAKEFAETTGTTAGSAHKTADATKAAAKVGGALAAILAGAAAVGAMRQEKGGDRTSTVGLDDRSPSTRPMTGSLGNDVPDYSARSDIAPERSSNVTPFVAGPIAAVLLPALGAGLFSAFSKVGIPKEHAERYTQALESGGIVVGVEARSGDEARVRGVLTA